MSYKGQPVPSTVHHSYRAKVSDGQSVRVPVPENTEIVAQRFYLIASIFGASMQSVKTGEGETAEVILDIEQAEYETDQIDATKAFAVGDQIYWDATNSVLTTTASGNRKVGRVSSPKDAKNVIWFILGPQIV